MIEQFNFDIQLIFAILNGMVSCGITKQFPISLHRLFFTSHKRSNTSETRMHYTMCWQLVFTHILLFVIYLALFS
jgi:hypothetical protein